ncbi:MAG TPA: aryl-sulfate sulfotransferase [Candidatus Marinimicrobia bacterium]|nr:aryl-sulfate sulfotransferase [Candidatus Neomarinimicrobiota bacterium]
MYINSHMQRMIKIALFILAGYLHAEMLPENGAELNYIQVFFRWDQIPSAENYQFTLQNMENGEESQLIISQNSAFVTDFLDWNSTYTWFVCALFTDDSTPFCSEIYSFAINPLPDYLPDEINIHTYHEYLSQDGVTIMDFESLNFSGGLDMEGKLIWFADKENFEERFVFTQFLKNGNMVGFGPGKGYEIDLDGHIVFETPPNINSVHHHITKTSNNTYFLISATVENQYCPEECNDLLPDEIPWQGDIFREVNQDGTEIWSWNTFDYYDLTTDYNPYYVEIYNDIYGVLKMDWTHSNSVFFDENSNSVFVSIRNLSRITKIDYASKNLIWNMGETDFMNEIYFNQDLNFSQQHSVQVLDNGNLLFFDNHRYLTPELSRCVEVSYDESDYSAEIVWEYVLPEEMFTGSRGECDRLENGNTLITAGRTGHTLEVTTENVIVWHLEVENMGFDVTKYRSSRIPNIYPVAFSLSINEYTGDVIEAYVEPINGMITINIYSSGWGEDLYEYTLKDVTGTELISDSIIGTDFIIDVSGLPSSYYILEVYPVHAPDKMQLFEFNLHGSIALGDMNGDGDLNVLDVVILANLILSGDDSNPAGDLNQDGSLNILDIVNLVHLILEN